MPEHEAEYLRQTWEACQTVTSVVGKTHSDQVVEIMKTRSAGNFSADQHVFCYNFAMTLGPPHKRCIIHFHFMSINATVLRIDVSYFGVIAEELGAENPWAKVVLVVLQYMTDPDEPNGYVATGSGFIARGVSTRVLGTNILLQPLPDGADYVRTYAC